MKTLLVIYQLSIQSSYAEDCEAAAEVDRFDTVQFFIGPDAAWRIRTFSIDEDVHIYSLGAPAADTLEVVCASTEKTYADIIDARHEFSADDGIAGLRRELERGGWSASMRESTQHGFAFWVPEDTDYRTRSAPP